MSTVLSLLKAIYNHNKTWICLFFLIIQQLIVAASTFFIIALGECIATQNDGFIIYLTLFIASLFIVYLPGIYAVIYLQKSKYIAFQYYIEYFKNINKHHTWAANDHAIRGKNEPLLTHEAKLVIDETGELGFSCLSTLFNAVFNTIVIGLVIDPIILVAYSISFSLLFMVGFISRKIITEQSIDMQTERKKMNQTLLSGWENILIGNLYNLNLWEKVFRKNWQSSSVSTVKYEVLVHGASALAMIIALVPVSGAVIWLFYKNAANWAILAALVVTLPRQIQILQNIFTFFSQLMQWSGVYAKLKGLLLSLNTTSYNSEKALERIQWDKITLVHNDGTHKIGSVDDILAILIDQKGRFTLQGENGTGKSTLLCLLKTKLKESAFYLPSSSTLFFESSLDKSLSSGQKMLAHLADIQSHVNEKYLLLDEWDANLDTKNTKNISDTIDQLSQRIAIIEVRHVKH